LSTLTELLALEKRERIALTGSGGKSTLMYQMAGELASQARRVITTTTTKIFIPSGEESPPWVLIEKDMTAFKNLWENSMKVNNLTIGWNTLGKKLEGIPVKVLEEIARWETVDIMLIEADGGRGKSLKGYTSYEPVIPEFVNKTIVVIGLDMLGKVLVMSRFIVHIC